MEEIRNFMVGLVVLAWAVVGSIIIGVSLASLVYFLNGLALSLLWGWFVVPVFGLPELSILVAIGLGIIVHLTAVDSSAAVVTRKLFVGPLIAIGIGWFVHQLILFFPGW